MAHNSLLLAIIPTNHNHGFTSHSQTVAVILLLSQLCMSTYTYSTALLHSQSTLRRPEVRLFAWKIGVYMARMGMNDMRGARVTTNKIGSKFNTVTLDRSYFTAYLSDL